MRGSELLDKMELADPAYIEAAEAEPKQKNDGWTKWAALAASIAIVALGVWGLIRLGIASTPSSSGIGGGEGITYMSYAGPVFPLSVTEADPDLTAARHIDFDFSPYRTRSVTESFTDKDGKEHSFTYDHYDSNTIVTDSYTLTNDSDTDKTVTAVYPFAGSLNDAERIMPRVTVGGSEMESSLHIGPYSGSFTGTADPYNEGTWNLANLDSWEKYKTLTESGYIDRAFDEYPELNQQVTVYEFSDRYGPDEDSASLSIEFNIDYTKTTILTYGFNGGGNDYETGLCRRDTNIPRSFNPDYGQSSWLIAVGEDIGEYQLKAYSSGDQVEVPASAGATVTRYETTLGEVFSKITDRFLNTDERQLYGDGQGTIMSGLTPNEFTGLAAELMYDWGVLSETPVDRYSDGRLDDIFGETMTMDRLMYLTFDVTVPAHGTASVSMEMVKEASMDFIGEKRNRNGYDMVTRLGSILTFTGQTAGITNYEYVEIIDQSFGFDPSQGITTATLDMDDPHYYMEIIKTAE